MLVGKSLRNLATDGSLAQVHEHWPLTLKDLDVRFLRALAPLMPSLSEKAIGFHGEPGAGKNSCRTHDCHGYVPTLDQESSQTL